MARRKKQKSINRLRPYIGVLISLLLVALVISATNGGLFPPANPSAPPRESVTISAGVNITPSTAVTSKPQASSVPGGLPGEGLALHVIDVGDGDCLLLQSGGHNMLIDAGHDKDFGIIDAYLQKVGVKAFDFALATHPHSDHIGSMDAFIQKYKPQRMLLSPRAHTTAQYERLLDSLIDTGIKPEKPKPGDSYALGGATLTVLAPIKDDYAEINDFSVVMRVDYGATSFLLTGDAEKASEADMLDAGRGISATVLKLGHHGSNTSTTKAFLQAVSPVVAVGSAAKDIAVADRLEKQGVSFYSTGGVGTMVLYSDGSAITLTAERLDEPVIFSSAP